VKRLIFIIILTTSCVKHDVSKLNTNENIDFNKDYTILEFQKLLDSYNDQKDYPDIDN
tara:strand:+ start:1041 stop:1214 length:174 start_codon:yes stop_codon:yes gene_type:complete